MLDKSLYDRGLEPRRRPTGRLHGHGRPPDYIADIPPTRAAAKHAYSIRGVLDAREEARLLRRG